MGKVVASNDGGLVLLRLLRMLLSRCSPLVRVRTSRPTGNKGNALAMLLLARRTLVLLLLVQALADVFHRKVTINLLPLGIILARAWRKSTTALDPPRPWVPLAGSCGGMRAVDKGGLSMGVRACVEGLKTKRLPSSSAGGGRLKVRGGGFGHALTDM